MRTNRRAFGILTITLVLAAFAAEVPAGSSPGQPDDWPCQQALVPEISAAVVWDGPTVAGLDWRADPAVAAVVERILPASVDQTTVERALDGLLAARPPAQHDQALTLVFAGVLERLNRDRGQLIAGIQRYARDQSRRAESISRSLDEMVRLERESAEPAATEARDLKAGLELQERAFDDRERAIQYLCHRPVVIEERLGLLARTISGLLSGS